MRFKPMSGDILRKTDTKEHSGRRVIFCILNMGLGHATRSLPLIRYFQELGYQIAVAGSGRSFVFLKKEIKGTEFYELSDYQLQYTEKGVSIVKLVLGLPNLMKTILREHRELSNLSDLFKPDMIISDHRYGCYSPEVLSIFLTHQVRFIAPHSLRKFEFLGALFNRYFHRKYSGVIIPDYPSDAGGLLSGRLAETGGKEHYFYSGILSSLQKTDGYRPDVDYFISISGPEPQRTVFENMIRAQINYLPGKKVVALGIPESGFTETYGNDVIIHHYLNRSGMEAMMNRSKLVICRSGYSTLMELVELQKKALFIPTPGQTEQIYLAKRLQKGGFFHYVTQQDLNLKRDTNIALVYPGMKLSAFTGTSLQDICHYIDSKLAAKPVL